MMTHADLLLAHDRIRPHIHRTPVLTSRLVDERAGSTVFFKCENLQKVGAFKIRGAMNAVLSLDDATAARGVVTHSSGNHAAALSYAARLRGIPAHIVMPRNSTPVKVDAVRAYGGRITFCEPDVASRNAVGKQVEEETGATLVHPYNDDRVIAGQATAAIEFLEEVPNLDAILTPVGGGGLLSGTILAVREMNPKVRVIGCEPALADDAAESLRVGHIVAAREPKTIADGLRTNLGDKTFAIIKEGVERIETTSEDEIRQALRFTMERMKIVIEPSSAVPLAVLLNRDCGLKGKRVGIILTGGNVDLGNLPI